MRVLWFANIMTGYKPLETDIKSPYNGGGWLQAAMTAIKEEQHIQLGYSSMLSGEPFKTQQDNVTYYPIPSPYHSLAAKIWNQLKYLTPLASYADEEKSWDYYLHYFKLIIDDFQPDIIHIWGSERHFGLIYKITNIPIVLHIQGIITPYFNAFLPPFISWKAYKTISINPRVYIQRLITKSTWEKDIFREHKIITGIKYHMGRTEWDQRITKLINPDAQYFHVDEILRDIFYDMAERHIPDKLVIVTTISQPIYKGFDLVLKTAKILKSVDDLEFEWLCYGNINPYIIEKQIGIYHKDVNVKLMGAVSANDLKSAELNATLYVHPSYIDNSPNSICEAQILGIPVVSTNTGGIPSIITDKEDGFLIPANDPYQAAYFILQLFKDKSLNQEMGIKAKRKALNRHHPHKVIQQILAVYNHVLSEHDKPIQ